MCVCVCVCVCCFAFVLFCFVFHFDPSLCLSPYSVDCRAAVCNIWHTRQQGGSLCLCLLLWGRLKGQFSALDIFLDGFLVAQSVHGRDDFGTDVNDMWGMCCGHCPHHALIAWFGVYCV